MNDHVTITPTMESKGEHVRVPDAFERVAEILRRYDEDGEAHRTRVAKLRQCPACGHEITMQPQPREVDEAGNKYWSFECGGCGRETLVEYHGLLAGRRDTMPEANLVRDGAP